jgi:hypothetical protein
MEQAHATPLVFILAEFASIGPQRRLDRQHMADQAFVFGVCAHERQIVVAGQGSRIDPLFRKIW